MGELSNTPEFPDPLAARLDEIHLLKDNSLRVWVEFEDGTMLCVEIPPESDGMARVIDALGGAMTELLSALGHRGLEVVGFTESDDDRDEAEDDAEEDE